MSCKTCATKQARTVVRTFAAGDTRASLHAAHAAQVERERTGCDVHVHYAATSDKFEVVRTGGAR
ncbi:hypothetical protein ACFCXP_37625 [Streptomyces niveus]|uniref:hypothetical protein n=1 Tax=Streptomyces niveus TaxID=193462 RepID=UPI0035DF1D9D